MFLRRQLSLSQVCLLDAIDERIRGLGNLNGDEAVNDRRGRTIKKEWPLACRSPARSVGTGSFWLPVPSPICPIRVEFEGGQYHGTRRTTRVRHSFRGYV